ncbi:ABC transporter permease [Aquabacterium soli]|uniref:ABC transporter permease n=1 Tax=Aquabacterium soli TaxID=2493092 RepID=A0A426V227_9BURK|nr:ABC transporter permease [Aquabacterium soli]RRS00935.1 ABC transporter permease [Aquabacterium soli]
MSAQPTLVPASSHGSQGTATLHVAPKAPTSATAPASGGRVINTAPSRERSTAWLGWLPPLLLLASLETAVRLGWVPSHLLPAPSDLLVTLWHLGTEVVGAHVLASTTRVAVGFGIGASLALVIGAAVGLKRPLEHLLDPSFQALRAIPSLAWVPLLLLWLGIDESPKIVLIAIGAFFPVYLGVSAGLRDVDRKLVEVARMAGLSSAALARRVLLPAALPSIMTGVRNGLSLAWMFMVAAELIAATKGLGYLLTDGRETGRADLVLSAIVLLAVLGKLSDSALRWWERRLLSWRDTFESQR